MKKHSAVVDSIQNYKGKKIRAKFLTSIVHVLLIASFICFFSFLYFVQLEKGFKYDVKINELNNSIAGGKLRSEELVREQNLHNSPEYIEKAARERLGYIKQDEIIYKINQ